MNPCKCALRSAVEDAQKLHSVFRKLSHSGIKMKGGLLYLISSPYSVRVSVRTSMKAPPSSAGEEGKPPHRIHSLVAQALDSMTRSMSGPPYTISAEDSRRLTEKARAKGIVMVGGSAITSAAVLERLIDRLPPRT